MDLNICKNIKEINIASFFEESGSSTTYNNSGLPSLSGHNYISQWHHLLGDEQGSEAHWASLTAPFHN